MADLKRQMEALNFKFDGMLKLLQGMSRPPAPVATQKPMPVSAPIVLPPAVLEKINEKAANAKNDSSKKKIVEEKKAGKKSGKKK